MSNRRHKSRLMSTICYSTPATLGDGNCKVAYVPLHACASHSKTLAVQTGWADVRPTIYVHRDTVDITYIPVEVRGIYCILFVWLWEQLYVVDDDDPVVRWPLMRFLRGTWNYPYFGTRTEWALTLCTSSVNGGAHKFNYYVNIMIISQLLLSLERNFNYMHAGRSIRDIYHGPSSG